MSELTFDEKAHEYRMGERSLPSVTAILKDAGLIDTRFFNDYAMTRGTFVHQACEMLDLGTLDEDTLDPALFGYVGAYKKFRAECPMVWTEIEHMRADSVLGYAGTPDRVGDRTVLDIKTGQKQPWHGFQLAAYTMLALNAPLNTLTKRLGLYLKDDGTYKLERYQDRADFDVFKAALIIYNAKRRI